MLFVLGSRNQKRRRSVCKLLVLMTNAAIVAGYFGVARKPVLICYQELPALAWYLQRFSFGYGWNICLSSAPGRFLNGSRGVTMSVAISACFELRVCD